MTKDPYGGNYQQARADAASSAAKKTLLMATIGRHGTTQTAMR